MHILVLTGSPHKQGTSALLADSFTRGAEEAGHQVVRFDAAFADISPCMGCESCRSQGGQCVYADDMDALWPNLLEADLIVLATPLYYFAMTAQLKTLLDRFYSRNAELRQRKRQACLLATCADRDDWAMHGLQAHYESVCRYLGWEDKGRVLAQGVAVRQDIEATAYPQEAYNLGRSL